MFWHYFRTVYLRPCSSRKGRRLVRRGMWFWQPFPCFLFSIWDGHKKQRPYLFIYKYMYVFGNMLDLCIEICIFCMLMLMLLWIVLGMEGIWISDFHRPSSVCHLSTTLLRRQLFGAKHKIALMQQQRSNQSNHNLPAITKAQPSACGFIPLIPKPYSSFHTKTILEFGAHILSWLVGWLVGWVFVCFSAGESRCGPHPIPDGWKPHKLL